MSCEINPKGLTAPDFFLWGYLKQLFATKPPTQAEHEEQDHRGNRENRRNNAGQGDGERALPRARSCVVHNGGHLTDVVFHAWKYKTYVHSHSFEVSFVLIGAIARSHDRNKSVSRLLGHPVTGDHYGIGQKFVICNFLNFESNLIKFGPHIGVIVAFVSCKNQLGWTIFWRLVGKYVQDCQSSYSPAVQNFRIYEPNSAEKGGCKTF